ncbi:unnamed protein product, partial [Rotaria sp. Silwood1]
MSAQVVDKVEFD